MLAELLLCSSNYFSRYTENKKEKRKETHGCNIPFKRRYLEMTVTFNVDFFFLFRMLM